MKNIFTDVILVNALLVFISCSQVEPVEITKERALMLNRTAIAIGRDTIEIQSHFKGVPSVLTFISPACEHCQYETQALLNGHDEKQDNLHLAFLSDVHLDSLKVFANQFEYDTTTTVFLWDEGGKIAQQMGVSSYPTMFLYDTAGVHLQTIVGEAKPSYVYKFFHETH